MGKTKKLLSLIICIALMVPTPVFAANSYSDDTDIEGTNVEMVDIFIEATDEYYIVVSIPAEKEEEYRNSLASDAEFRKQEIQYAIGGSNISTYALPEGPIEHQSYLYKSDIKKAVDAASGTGAFDKWLTVAGKLIDLAEIKGLLELSKKASFAAWAADFFVTLLQWTLDREEEWWREAYMDILNGEISAVRYTIVQNVTGEYPKVWRIFERI